MINQVRFPLSPTSSLDSFTPPSLETAVAYLTRLPLELLEHICKLVDLPNREIYALGLVSKAFLPFARSQTFRYVSMIGRRRLDKLVALLKVRPGLEDLIQKVRLFLVVEDWRADKQGYYNQVYAFLQCLPKCEQLEIRNDFQIGPRNLFRLPLPSLLPSLRKLRLGYHDTPNHAERIFDLLDDTLPFEVEIDTDYGQVSSKKPKKERLEWAKTAEWCLM
jgi:hypothetical protein